MAKFKLIDLVVDTTFCLAASFILLGSKVDASCANLGWVYGYSHNNITINTSKLPTDYANITKTSSKDWTNWCTGYKILTTSEPACTFGYGEHKNYIYAYSLKSSTTTGRTCSLTAKSSGMRRSTSFSIIYNTDIMDSMTSSDKNKYARSVMGHELGHVLSLDDMDKSGEGKYATASIMSYSRDRYTLVTPQFSDSVWVKYYK